MRGQQYECHVFFQKAQAGSLNPPSPHNTSPPGQLQVSCLSWQYGHRACLKGDPQTCAVPRHFPEVSFCLFVCLFVCLLLVCLFLLLTEALRSGGPFPHTLARGLLRWIQPMAPRRGDSKLGGFITQDSSFQPFNHFQKPCLAGKGVVSSVGLNIDVFQRGLPKWFPYKLHKRVHQFETPPHSRFVQSHRVK